MSDKETMTDRELNAVVAAQEIERTEIQRDEAINRINIFSDELMKQDGRWGLLTTIVGLILSIPAISVLYIVYLIADKL